jgi:hypothetical protein
MKTLGIILALLGSAAGSCGQGFIVFGNNVLNRVTMVDSSGRSMVAPTSISINYGLFIGSTEESMSAAPHMPLGITHPTSPGVFHMPSSEPSSVIVLPGRQAGETLFLQVRGWSAEFGIDWQAASVSPGAWFGETDVRPFILVEFPGTVIWGGQFHPDSGRFYPLVLHQVPEPSAVVLGVLGALLLFLRHRNSTST